MTKRKVEDEEVRLLKEVPRGEFVRIVTPTGKVGKTTYVIEEYDRSCKAYWLQNYEDISSGKYLSGDRKVLVGFTY